MQSSIHLSILNERYSFSIIFLKEGISILDIGSRLIIMKPDLVSKRIETIYMCSERLERRKRIDSLKLCLNDYIFLLRKI